MQEVYDWDCVVDQYEDLLAKMADKPLADQRPTKIQSLSRAPLEKSISRSAYAFDPQSLDSVFLSEVCELGDCAWINRRETYEGVAAAKKVVTVRTTQRWAY